MGARPPDPQQPAAAPAPPLEGAQAPALNETAASERNTLAANRRGRGSLRIDRATAAPTAGSGLTIAT